MHKKKQKKAAGQKECISKSKKMQKETRKKNKKEAEQQFKKKQKQCKKMHMHNQISHTTFVGAIFLAIFLHCLCDFFAFFVRFLALFLHFCAFFVRLFGDCFAFSQGNAQKMPKNKHLKNANTKQKECKGKDQNVFDRIRFVF